MNQNGSQTTIIMDIIFWDFLIIEQIFFSSQVKRIVIISNKYGIYELPNKLKLRILGNLERSGKSQNFIDS